MFWLYMLEVLCLDGLNEFSDGSNDFWWVERKCFVPLVPMFSLQGWQLAFVGCAIWLCASILAKKLQGWHLVAWAVPIF
jgi:hypothetical protein